MNKLCSLLQNDELDEKRLDDQIRNVIVKSNDLLNELASMSQDELRRISDTPEEVIKDIAA